MSKPAGDEKKEKFKIALLAYLVVLALLSGITASAAAAVVMVDSVKLPKLDTHKVGQDPQRTRLLAADGSTLAVFYYQNRENTTLDQIPPVMQKAILAVEDKRFYKHGGIDPGAIGRAMIRNVKSGQVVEGGSTISQQYVKNAFLTNERTMSRKLKEVALAYQLEKKYPKKKILALYLNSVYFGDGAWGIKAAAEHYFDKPSSQLNLQEAALLAAMPKGPAAFSPYYAPRAAKARRDLVLRKMLETKSITRQQYQAAVSQPVLVAEHNQMQDQRVAYFVEYVRNTMVRKYGAKTFLRGGWSIHTTLDPRMQSDAQQAIETTLDRPGDPSASLVSIEPKTGYIRAMVGGKDFASDNFNLAVQARRQAGSSFKPFVLITALEQGISPDTSFSGASPTVIPMPQPAPNWTVNNFGNQGYASLSLVEATVKSVNVVYAQLIMRVGPSAVVDVAHRMGIRSEIDANPSIALGGFTYGVSPLDMASAYSTLANRGRHTEPTAVAKIVDPNGAIIYEHKPVLEQALKEEVADTATDVLKQVVQRGTGTRANIGRPAAGKTGSSSNLRDAWFVGYTPQLATAVWVGYPKQQIAMNSVHGIGVTGGSFPAEIWQKYMSDALAGMEVLNFDGSKIALKEKEGSSTSRQQPQAPSSPATEPPQPVAETAPEQPISPVPTDEAPRPAKPPAAEKPKPPTPPPPPPTEPTTGTP